MQIYASRPFYRHLKHKNRFGRFTNPACVLNVYIRNVTLDNVKFSKLKHFQWNGFSERCIQTINKQKIIWKMQAKQFWFIPRLFQNQELHQLNSWSVVDWEMWPLLINTLLQPKTIWPAEVKKTIINRQRKQTMGKWKG